MRYCAIELHLAKTFANFRIGSGVALLSLVCAPVPHATRVIIVLYHYLRPFLGDLQSQHPQNLPTMYMVLLYQFLFPPITNSRDITISIFLNKFLSYF